MFSRQHYWTIANLIATLPSSEYKYELILDLCDMFEKDNAKFKPEKFIEACEETVPHCQFKLGV